MRREKNPLDLKQVFSIDLHANKNFFRLVAARFVFLIGIYGVQTFAQYYIRDVMQAPNPVKATGELMAALAVALVLCSVLGGWLTDRFGSRRVLVLASLLSAAGCFLLITARDLQTMTLYSSLLGAGSDSFSPPTGRLPANSHPRARQASSLGLPTWQPQAPAL